MADYDCDFCNRSTYNGGKCNRYESECPFSVVRNYNSEKLIELRNAFEDITKAVNKVKELDTEEYLDEELSILSHYLSDIEDKISENTEEEWKEQEE